MEKKNDTPSPAGWNDRGNGAAESGSRRGWLAGGLPFAAGLIVALAFGWGIFPSLLFEGKEQPVAFNHQAHLAKAKLGCIDCHSLREDGSFRGLPSTADCAVCHAKLQGGSSAERAFVDTYVRTGKEVKWLVYQKQPDNVFFSHAAHRVENCNACHDFGPTETCNLCHENVAFSTRPFSLQENRLTGYSSSTLQMDQCERCHAHPKHRGATRANNACFTCHK